MAGDEMSSMASGLGGGMGGGMGESQGEGKPRRGNRGPVVRVDQLFDRVPPHSLDAERSLLGSILLEPRILTETLHLVSKPDQFYKEAHGAIFKALLDTYDAHESGDIVQLAEALRGRGVLDRVGGSDYLVELAECVPSSVAAPHYARIVADTARLRRLIETAGEILYKAFHEGMAGPDTARTVIDQAEQAVFKIAQEEDATEPETLRELLLAEMERIDRADGKAISGIGTGFHDMDELLSGLQKGELLIMAARPSMGKTALALNISEQIAFGGVTPWDRSGSKRRVPVGVFSLEMSRGSLVQRLISARSGVDSHKIRTGAVGEDEWRKLQEACDELSDAPIFIDDTPGMTVLQLRARARRMKHQHHIEAIVIDYLQLLTSPGSARESRQVEVSEISRNIKALARQLEVPVVCLAQLNRGAEQREGNRPRMSDLRESGSIEQDADVVMLLHREAYYHRGEPAWDPESPEFDPENEDKLNVAEVIIAKQRNGPTGTVKLVWDSATTRFKNHDGRSTASGWGHRDITAGPSVRAGAQAGVAAPADDIMAGDASGEMPPFGDPVTPMPAPGSGSGGGAETSFTGSAFGNREPTGPVENHRDGGGSMHKDEFEDYQDLDSDDGIAPF
ncbi:MAG: replicative DNA helicase [Planctomycetota bacterium]